MKLDFLNPCNRGFHVFEARYDTEFTTVDDIAECSKGVVSIGAIKELLKMPKKQEYIQDVCTRCGEVR